MIDYVLLRLYIEFEEKKKIKVFFKNDKIFCQSMYQELEISFKEFESKTKNATILALLIFLNKILL